MVSCDICGAPSNLSAVVEGAAINVCMRCSRYGKVVNEPRQYANRPIEIQREINLISGYGKVISNARITSGLTLDQLALKLNLREKDLLHFEEEKAKPTEKDCQKIGMFLKIQLIKPTETVQPTAPRRTTSRELTLADVVVIKDKRGKH